MNALDELIPVETKVSIPRTLYAIVVGVDPLSVTIDGDEEPLEIEPSTTVDGILLGDKVACLLQDDELIVTGIIDGDVDWVEEFASGIGVAQDAAETASIAAVAAAADASTAMTAANGKNKVYRGSASDLPVVIFNPGDIWFDEDQGNLPNIYDGSAWVPSPLGSAAIGNLDVGELTGDSINGNLVVAGSLRTATSGGRVEMDSGGIRAYDPSDALQTSLNTDGTSTFRGQVEATGVEVLGKLKFHGSDSEIAAGGRLNITGGVTPPSTAPSIYPEWLTVTLAGVPKANITGVTRDPANGDWIVASTAAAYGAAVLTGPTVTRHNPTTGAWEATIGTFPSVSGHVYPTNGGIAFVDGTPWVPTFFREYDPSLGYMATTRIISMAGTTKNILAKAPTAMWNLSEYVNIGNVSATQIAVSLWDFTRAAGTEGRLLLYTPSTSTSAGNVYCAAVQPSTGAVSYGPYDFGANRFALCWSDWVDVYQTTGAADSTKSFRIGYSVRAAGHGWHGGSWWTAHRDGKCRIYDGPAVGPVGAEFAAAWYDSNATGGVHETPLSPSGWSEIGISRARLRVHPPYLTTTAGTDGVDSLRLYARVGGSMRLQGTLATPGTSLLLTGGTLASGTIHGSVANFPATSPGSIENQTGEIILPGSGMAQLSGISLLITLASQIIDDIPHGIYLASNTSLITLARGYPVAGVAGVLECIGYATGTGRVQRFTTLETIPRTFTRAYSSGWGSWVGDGGHGPWVDVVVRSGFAHQGASKLQYCLTTGGYVEFRWGVSKAGMSANGSYIVADIPAEARPDRTKYFQGVSSSAAAQSILVIETSGTIAVRTGATLGSYYLFDQVRYALQ